MVFWCFSPITLLLDISTTALIKTPDNILFICRKLATGTKPNFSNILPLTLLGAKIRGQNRE